MNALAQQRCAHHALREAVARCPECRHFFCRECVTEHDDRILCAGCLKRLTTRAPDRRRRLTPVLRAVQLVTGLLLCWLFFYWCGRVLLRTPSSFHEGTFWQEIEP